MLRCKSKISTIIYVTAVLNDGGDSSDELVVVAVDGVVVVVVVVVVVAVVLIITGIGVFWVKRRYVYHITIFIIIF